jgi:hypothetical protein
MNKEDLCWECEDKKYNNSVFCIRHLTERYIKMAEMYENQHNPTYANWYKDRVIEIKKQVSNHPEELLE